MMIFSSIAENNVNILKIFCLSVESLRQVSTMTFPPKQTCLICLRLLLTRLRFLPLLCNVKQNCQANNFFFLFLNVFVSRDCWKCQVSF
jgi:hypothetical protein